MGMGSAQATSYGVAVGALAMKGLIGSQGAWEASTKVAKGNQKLTPNLVEAFIDVSGAARNTAASEFLGRRPRPQQVA